MVSNKKSYLQWRAMHFMLKPAMISYLNHTLCWHHQHCYTVIKAMDIIYLLTIAWFFLDCYTTTDLVWSFLLES